MGLPIYQVDAFTAEPFGGNPAAVCLLDAERDDSWLQAVSAEMNLAETAFLLPTPLPPPAAGRGAKEWNLRWFTPTVEVELCGHATLASAHILWEIGALAPGEQARFHTLSGILTADRRGDWIELDFPATLPVEGAPPAGLLEALGVAPLWVGRSKFDYLVEVEWEELVRELDPDLTMLREVQTRGVIVTAAAEEPGDSGYDFVSRFFAPAVGIDEDPATGSSHCCLAPFWSGKLRRPDLTGRQLSARGGTIRTRLEGDRVKLGGQAVTILRGELAA